MPMAKGGAAKAKLNTAPTAGNAEENKKKAAAAAQKRADAREYMKRANSKQEGLGEGSADSPGGGGHHHHHHHHGRGTSHGGTGDISAQFATLRPEDLEGDGGDIDAGMINIKRTMAEMDRWPGIVQGYLELTAYTAFFCLYVVVLLQQLDIGPSYAIDTMIRKSLLDQPGKLSAVAGHADVFAYLLQSYGDDGFDDTSEPMGGLLGDMFADKWYNDDPISADETGYLFAYNRLIGGVQLEQTRGMKGSCKGDSSYKIFYPDCYNDTLIETYPPLLYYNSTTRKNVYNETDAKFLAELEKTKFGDRALLDDPNSEYYSTVKDSFEFNFTTGSFRVFLDLAKGTAFNLQKIDHLRKMRWLDRQTRDLTLKFTFYNGNYRRFAFAQVNFRFDQGGQYVRYDDESAGVQKLVPGGISVATSSVLMEPYIVPEDFVRLGLEIVLMIWTFFYIANFIRSFIVAAISFKLKDHLSSWMILDATNYLCFILFFIMRVNLINYVVNNMVEVPTNSYQPVFQIAAGMTKTQLKVNFVNCLLCVFRFFKFYQFQPRLQIVNKTLAASTVNLYHFTIIFFVIFVGFAVIGNIMFGGQYRDFHTILNSMQALFETISSGNYGEGPTICNSLLVYPNNAIMGIIYFISWVFICIMVLLNVFVAILMDSYAEAVDEGKNAAKRLGQEEPAAVSDDIGKAINKIVRTFDPRSWRFSEQTLYHALAYLDRNIPNPTDKTAIFKRELERLQEERGKLDERIEELELMVDDPESEMYHPIWHHKSVTPHELAKTLPKVAKVFRRHEADGHTVGEVWEDHLLYAPEENAYVESDESSGEALLRKRMEELIRENAAIRSALAEVEGQ